MNVFVVELLLFEKWMRNFNWFVLICVDVVWMVWEVKVLVVVMRVRIEILRLKVLDEVCEVLELMILKLFIFVRISVVE